MNNSFNISKCTLRKSTGRDFRAVARHGVWIAADDIGITITIIGTRSGDFRHENEINTEF